MWTIQWVNVLDIYPSLLTGCSEKFLKKLIGNRDVEDSLEKLDKLTQEEARIASAEHLKMTHSVDGKVTGVDVTVTVVEGQVQGVRGDVQDVRGDVQDVRGDVRDVGDKVQGVDDKVQDIDNNVRGVDDKLQQANSPLSFNPDRRSAGSGSFTVKQLRDGLLQWLTPANPSVNHNIACKAHYAGTTQWFFKRSIYNQWKSTGSFLWIHGKRELFFIFRMRRTLIISHF